MGYNATHVLDPTFMLNAQNWESHMSNRKIKEPYLLAYLPYDIPNKSLIYKSIRRIFNQNGLKNVSFSQKDFMREKLADRTIYFTDPGDFLSLVYHASFVVTTSFHGTAFCINLNKHFFVYLPTGFGTLITSILNMFSLRNRLLDSCEVISDEQLNMKAPVMGIIGQERKKTIDFLQNALSKNMYFRTSDKKECSGCTACVNACPQSCISMELNSGGFAYPLIDKNTALIVAFVRNMPCRTLDIQQ